ncbi:exonuclease SbcCD subunit D [Cyanobium sp. Aljojuca 7D2]|uniref:exonuclease SbcCD subunit D n=1 Tax=Cyanobium sp. Aljojuca 7D2 TaxID=2823698 RepID=UPI0020CD3CB9|nr:exonuclease SbcCD subunit D [Cyanobium sp. Aljojuca 7D2]MCP9892118.1 exonuclease SbcCD subunit D [Cyanobium sp. Aljojuca 7D2]
MRLLHTSDWHLGRQFHGASLLQEQAAALDRIVELAAEAEVDAVLIAGDIYDRAIPPAEAVLLFNDTLARLSRSGAAVVAIAGNHDSHVRVSIYDPLLSAFGVTIRGDVRRAHEPVLVTPKRGGAPVAIYPLPYLEPAVDGPSLVAVAEAVEAGSSPGSTRVSHQEVTRLALDGIRRDLLSRPQHRSVLVAHTFVMGGEPSESERQLSIGNVDRVSVDSFAGFDYVALGHLHGSQQLDGPRVAYSGTPLPYSFSEQHHTKSVRIVELDAAGTASVEIVPLGVGRPLRTLEGPLECLCGDPQHAAAADAWLRVILTDEVLPLQAMARLRQRFPHVAELRHRPPELQRSTATERHETVRQATSPLALAMAFFADQQGRPAGPPEAELLRQALEASTRGGEQ